MLALVCLPGLLCVLQVGITVRREVALQICPEFSSASEFLNGWSTSAGYGAGFWYQLLPLQILQDIRHLQGLFPNGSPHRRLLLLIFRHEALLVDRLESFVVRPPRVNMPMKRLQDPAKSILQLVACTQNRKIVLPLHRQVQNGVGPDLCRHSQGQYLWGL